MERLKSPLGNTERLEGIVNLLSAEVLIRQEGISTHRDRALWFPRIRYLGNQLSLQCFRITLDGEDLPLLQLLLQSFFERRQELSRFLLVGCQHAVDDNSIMIADTRHRPKAFIGLGKEGKVVYLLIADKYFGPLPSRLHGVNQTVIRSCIGL